MIVKLSDSTTTKTVQYWKQERFVVEITTAAGDIQLHNVSISPSLIATYKVVGGKVTIDVTDFVRANPNLNQVVFYWAAGHVYFTVNYTIAGLIDPATMFIPPHELHSAGALIIPPSRMIAISEIETVSDDLITNFYATTSGWQMRDSEYDEWRALANGQIGDEFLDGGWIEIRQGSAGAPHRFIIEPQYCSLYATVQWVGAAGYVKRHTFIVKQQDTESVDDYSLLVPDNTYKTIKGREDGLTLFLDDLTAYDYWYYSDILTSSEVILTGTSLARFDTPVRLEIETGGVEIPMNDFRRNKLEFKCKYKHYDAVDM